MSPDDRRSYISEWFGHRIYPKVLSDTHAIDDQRTNRCPFLSTVKKSESPCVKLNKSKGVCTISSTSNGSRQDWVACPYRIISPELVERIAKRLFVVAPSATFRAVAAPALHDQAERDTILHTLGRGGRVLVYFDQKLGGEISVKATPRSPEMAFDVTLVELHLVGDKVLLGKYALLEVQTMDFHGSYARAVSKLSQGLELHPKKFAKVLGENQWWASDGIEGPNIANVFKRTFYQIVFKFGFAASEHCVGTALTIPRSVWDSWRSFLAAPTLEQASDGTLRIVEHATNQPSKNANSWIYVVDIDAASDKTPSPLRVEMEIAVTAEQLTALALEDAPRAAGEQLTSATGIYSILQRRLNPIFPGIQPKP